MNYTNVLSEEDCSHRSIAVLMAVHDRKDTTRDCLRHLYACQLQENIALDVYLVNDGCTDGTPQMVASEFPLVKIIEGDGNLYWNRGMWTAWNEASKQRYDYYLWLNDDTLLFEGAISELLRLSQRYNNRVIAVGATLDMQHGKITYGGRIDGKIPDVTGQPVEVDYFNGNIVLIPSNVFDILGNMDPYFTHSKGDFDYGLRAKKQGIKMFQVGNALGMCDSHPTIDRWCDPTVPFLKRWKSLHKPNGMPPCEIFHLNVKHYGIIQAVFHYFAIYVRCIYPSYWVNR